GTSGQVSPRSRLRSGFPVLTPQASGYFLTLIVAHSHLIAAQQLTSGSLIGLPGLAIHLRVLRLVSLDERAIGMQLVQLEVEEGFSTSPSRPRSTGWISG
ncbi:MAG: hypothetical protein M3Z66_03285, partial [Chloroflexota bacterium]|nr:hypothetical protein [Chloroflexota bacterium]